MVSEDMRENELWRNLYIALSAILSKKMVKEKSVCVILCILFLLPIVFAHDGDNSTSELTKALKTKTWWALLAAGSIAALLVVTSLSLKPKKDRIKWILFLGIALPIASATVYLTYATVHLNVISETGGPVHWHADYEVYICNQHLDLVKAEGFSNLVGDPVLHEHGDNRIHVEGVLVKKKDANLESFFKTVGGFLNENQFVFPSDNGIISVSNGEKCPSGREGVLQTFVYQTKEKKIMQQKITDAAHYILSPHGNVPPGDCIIIEFGDEKDKTTQMCKSYKVAMQRGELSGS